MNNPIPPSLIHLAAALLIILLTIHLSQIHSENKQLQTNIELLEESFIEERKKAQSQYDSLQSKIVIQQKQQNALKEKIISLEKSKADTNEKYHEKKNTIRHIRTIDSLHDEVARHYRH